MSKRIALLRYMSVPRTLLELSKEFNLSRLGVEQLIASVAEIERDLVRLNGLERFFLSRKLDWLDVDKIKNSLEIKHFSEYTVEVIDEIPSTNSYVITKIDDYANKAIVTTEYQSFGRGRSNKRWMSRIATDITVSFVYWFSLDFQYQLLPLITAIAVNRLLKNFQVRSKIKWPNDVLLDSGDKVCGVLVEGGVRQDKRFAVIGIGLDNIIELERNTLLVELVRSLDNVLSEFEVFGFNLLKREWLDNCIHYQKPIKVIKGQAIVSAGLNVGISDSGSLLVTNDIGEILEYTSANITLRW